MKVFSQGISRSTLGYFEADKANIAESETLMVRVSSFNKGLHWLYTNKKTGGTLSIILHEGSYGGGLGYFEACPSWRSPFLGDGDSVIGYLSFGEVQALIDELEARK